jgi:hypothetical protein
MGAINQAVVDFGVAVSERFAVGGGEPEDLLRGPFERLLKILAEEAGVADVVPSGEHRLAEERIRPDYAVYVGGAIVGFIELKAPGKGVDTASYKGHDRKQWERLAFLPNVLYGDGQSFALYREGERVGKVVRFNEDVTTAGPALAAKDDELLALFEDFLRWQPTAPRNARQLARISARLCRVLRAEVHESMDAGSVGLRDLAEDWRQLLYPSASDDEFADGYAQTVTFALLLARVEEIELEGQSLQEVADQLGSSHTLMAKALTVLTDPTVLPKVVSSVSTLQRVLAVVDWPTVSQSDPKAWLLFYEEFLGYYDEALRKQTGSYYTPVEAVDPMVRIVDGLLRDRLGHREGFASTGVTVVDPAAGAGTFLFRIVDRIAESVATDLGPGAVGPALRKAAERLIGFELQAGPYAVAELRLATEFERLGAALKSDELRVYLTDTLGDPFVEETHIAATYRPIAESRRRANTVKREESVMVVMGNPPYKERSKGHGGWVEQGSGASVAPLGDFMPPRSLGVGAHTKHLYNLYVYFWRWALWKVFEGHPTDRGVVAFVSMSGFLHGPGFAQMRHHMRKTSDAIWVIDLSPEGHQPEVATRVFAGVQQPICITIAVRDGSTDADVPAPVQYIALSGRREQKLKALAALELDAPEWRSCGSEWTAPFLPAGDADWTAMPALEDLLAWSGSGTMPGRTWVIGPSSDVLQARWRRLISSPKEEQPFLLAEHKQDRTVDTVLSDNLPGYEPRGPIASETEATDEPVRYGWRTLDRGWILPDKRVINRPNPRLWQVRNAAGQLYLTCLDDHSPSAGPAVSSTALVPDLHHYNGRGGRAFPLWLDSAGVTPNAVPGLLEFIGQQLGKPVSGPDLFAYVAAVTGGPGYVARFEEDLHVPGLRIPLTADPDVFSRAVKLGSRVLWLHTYGDRFVDDAADRPARAPRAPELMRPKVTVAIPDSAEAMPEEIEYDLSSNELIVGDGRISNVTAAMWEYETSGYKLVRRWFARRKRDPDGKRSSALDDVVASSWDPEWTSELIDLLNVLRLLVEMETELDQLLDDLLAGEQFTVSDLKDAGVLPVDPTKRPVAEKPARQLSL